MRIKRKLLNLQFFGGRGASSGTSSNVKSFRLDHEANNPRPFLDITDNDMKVIDIVRNAPVGTEIRSIWHWNNQQDEVDVYRVVNENGKKNLQHVEVRRKGMDFQQPLWLNSNSDYSRTSDWDILRRLSGTEVQVIGNDNRKKKTK